MRRRVALGVAVAALAAGAAVALIGGGSAVDPATVTARSVAALAKGPPMLASAKRESPDAYRRARAIHARIAGTPDGRSFYVQWPANAHGGKAIVTFHGYLSTAFDGLFYWQREAARLGYTVIAIQWRLGKHSTDSYRPPAMEAQARKLLRRIGVAPANALLHGYSSAATRVYPAAALDRRGARYYALFVGDAGAARLGSPLYDQVFGGGFGPRPLAGTRWVLFCGGRDPTPSSPAVR